MPFPHVREIAEFTNFNRFRYVFIIDGHSPTTIQQSYVKIAKEQNIRSEDHEAACAEAMRWIESLTDEWLMIFDDYRPITPQNWLPGKNRGNIIYTSRSTELGLLLPAKCVIEVGPLTEAEAVELLLMASGSDNSLTSTDDFAAAQKLVEELGYLPLSIQQAARTIREERCTLPSYLTRLQSKKVRILTDPHFRGKDIENKAVYATLELSKETIETMREQKGRSDKGRCAELSLKLLKMLCFYHNKDIPVSFILRAAQERQSNNFERIYPLKKVMQSDDFDYDLLVLNRATLLRTARFLESFSLIKLSPDQTAVSMHVLVQSWIQQRMDEDEYLRHSLLARILITESIIPSMNWIDKYMARAARPHIDACYAHPHIPINHDRYETGLRFKLGWYHQVGNRFEQAESCYLDCIHFYKMEYGNHGWTTINAMNSLATLYHENGYLTKAEITYWEVLSRLEERERESLQAILLEEQNECGSDSQNNTSGIRQKVTQLQRKILERLGRKLSNDGPGIIRVNRSNLSTTLRHVSTMPPEPPDDLKSLNIYIYLTYSRLAEVYIDQDRKRMGKKWLLNALEELTAALDDETHPQLMELTVKVKRLTDPANFDYWSNFCSMSSRAIEENKGTDMESYTLQVDGMIRLAFADCLLKNRMWEYAYWFYFQIYSQYKVLYGVYDQKCLEILLRMVDCLFEADRCDEGVMLAKECVRRARKTYGEHHKSTILALEKLADAIFWQRLESNEDTIRILEEAKSRAEVGLGFEHSITRRIRILYEQHRQLDVDFKAMHSFSNVNDSYGSNEDLDYDPLGVWEGLKSYLESLKKQYGPYHIITRRVARLVGDKPIETPEEFAERLLRALGPHNSQVKRCWQQLRKRYANQHQKGELEEGKEDFSCPNDVGPAISLANPIDDLMVSKKGKEKEIIQHSKELGNTKYEGLECVVPDLWGDTESLVEPPEPDFDEPPEDVSREILKRSEAESLGQKLRNVPVYLIGQY